jgi:hypothetical protein
MLAMSGCVGVGLVVQWRAATAHPRNVIEHSSVSLPSHHHTPSTTNCETQEQPHVQTTSQP